MFGLTHRRRQRLKAQPFPDEWAAIIGRNVPFYARLPADDQRELQGHIQVFLAEKRFDGCGLLITDEIRVTIAANVLLADQIQHHNQNFVCRTTGLTPIQSWELACTENRSRMRPAPIPPLLDLHLAHYVPRRLNPDHSVDFLGRNWPITPCRRKYVTLVYHPGKAFWVIPEPPTRDNPAWPNVLARYSL